LGRAYTKVVDTTRAFGIQSIRDSLLLISIRAEVISIPIAAKAVARLRNSKIGIIPFFGTSRLVEHHAPFTCEAHILRALATLVLEELAGHSTFLEHYILDFKRDLMFNYMKHVQI
jgi:hypothetical protein